MHSTAEEPAVRHFSTGAPLSSDHQRDVSLTPIERQFCYHTSLAASGERGRTNRHPNVEHNTVTASRATATEHSTNSRLTGLISRNQC
jgi:hypothetical protein